MTSFIRHDVDEFALEYSGRLGVQRKEYSWKRIFIERNIPKKDPFRNPMKLKFVELPQSLDAKEQHENTLQSCYPL
jgi:hypothetical protein